MQDKKSQVEDLLSFLFTVIVIFLVALIFSYMELNKTKSLKEKVNLEISDKDATISILNFLRSDIDVQNKKMNIADALNVFFVANDKDTLARINMAANEFFSNSYLESDWTSWLLKINYGEEKSITIESAKSKSQFSLRKEISRTIIPSHHNSKPIEIILYKTSYGESRTRPFA